MSTKRSYRPPFDLTTRRVMEALEYVAGPRGMTLNGARLEPGAPFDKSKVTPRRLRQLYDTRQINLAPGQVVPKAQRRVGAGPSALPAPHPERAAKPGRVRAISRRVARRAAA